MRVLVPSLFSLAWAASLSAIAAAQAPGAVERLGELEDRLEAARVQAHVPGMSIAIVQDGKVVLARGFGFADVAAERAADAATVYAIGSTTKAFTATVLSLIHI